MRARCGGVKSVRVVLVAPPLHYEQWGENLGLGMLAAVLRRDGADVEILDAYQLRTSERETAQHILDAKPDLVGIQVLQSSADVVRRLAHALRDGGLSVPILVGGYFPTLATDTCFSFMPVDVAVIGEGEETISEMVNAIRGEREVPRGLPGTAWVENGLVCRGPSRPLIRNLDSLPFPARDWLSLQLKHVPVAHLTSSRGCYGNCTFCSIRSFYGAPVWRARSAESVVEEIERLLRDFNVDVFGFEDDSFIGPPPHGPARAAAIAELILQRHLKVRFGIACRADDVKRDLFALLKRAGLTAVVVGVETFDPNLLRRLQKGITPETNRRALAILKQLGINCEPGVILADWETSLEELTRSVSALEQTNFRFTARALLTPWMGTSVHKSATLANMIAGSLEKPTILYRDEGVSLALGALRAALMPWDSVDKSVGAMEAELYKLLRTQRQTGRSTRSVEASELVLITGKFKAVRNAYRKAKVDVYRAAIQYGYSGSSSTLDEALIRLREVATDLVGLAEQLNLTRFPIPDNRSTTDLEDQTPCGLDMLGRDTSVSTDAGTVKAERASVTP